MAKDKMNIPQIRFKGFEGEWESKRLELIIKTYSFRKYLAEPEDKGLYPVIQQGNKPVIGYSNNEPFMSYKEVILFGDHTLSLYRPTSPFLLSTDGLKILNLQGLEPTYAFYLISRYMPLSEGYKRHFSILKEQMVFYPKSIEEQTAIGNFFQKIDQVIELQQKALNTARAYKQSMLQKMFPQKEEKVPRVRFAGFSGDWEVSSLGSIGKIKSGIGFSESEQGGTKGTPFFKVSDMNLPGNENVMTTANNYVSENQIISNKWKVITDIPSIIFAKVGAAIFLNRKRIVKESFLIDNNMMAYSFDEVWDSSFGKTLFDTLNLSRFAQVGALPSFNGSDIASIKILLPTKAEQTAIGNFFQKLDQQIEQQAQKLATYQQLKKAMLQRMFV